MTLKKKLSLSLEVRALAGLQRLPGGNSSNKQWPGWEESLTMFLAPLRQREVAGSSKNCSWQPMIFFCCFHYSLQQIFMCCRAACVPHWNIVCQDELHRCSVEGNQHPPLYVIPPEPSQEVGVSDLPSSQWQWCLLQLVTPTSNRWDQLALWTFLINQCDDVLLFHWSAWAQTQHPDTTWPLGFLFGC